MSREVITLKDSLSQSVLQHAIEREKRVLLHSITQIETKIADWDTRYGSSDPKELFEQVDDMEIVEWEGEKETLARLCAQLQRLEEIQVESS